MHPAGRGSAPLLAWPESPHAAHRTRRMRRTEEGELFLCRASIFGPGTYDPDPEPGARGPDPEPGDAWAMRFGQGLGACDFSARWEAIGDREQREGRGVEGFFAALRMTRLLGVEAGACGQEARGRGGIPRLRSGQAFGPPGGPSE